MESLSSQQRSLSDLPVGTLSHVSSYLALPSRALFAVALNCRDDLERCSAIVGEMSDILDFGDIEKELAARLSDHDIKAVLLSIDAINNLKTLRLTNLLNITGIGLEPLRGSTTIEKIDLSLVGDRESPDLSPAPPISCSDVLPILDSIIDVRGESSLKLLIFPKEWRKERDINSEFHAFLVQYNELLCSRVVTCLKCNNNLVENDSMMTMGHYHYEHGTQKHTCYDCLKHYCYDCFEEGEGELIDCMSDLCWSCNRHYCFHCSRERVCTSCNVWYCVDCMDMKQCVQCDEIVCLSCISNQGCRNSCCDGKIWCGSCSTDFDVLRLCDNCDAGYCVGCYESNTDDVYSINHCDDCDEILCGECRVIKCKDDSDCLGCYRFAFSALLEEKVRMEASRDAD